MDIPKVHDKPFTNSRLEHMVKHMKNEELKYFLRKAKSSNRIFDNGTTFLHLAVKYNNLELLEYLLDIGHDVNAKNSSGDTALLIALKTDNFKAIKTICNANPDISVIDASTGRTTLGLLMAKRGDVEDYVELFMENLKKSNFEVERIINLVISANCSLRHILFIENAQVTREFLKRNPSGDHEVRTMRAMQRGDLETVEMILRYGNESGKKGFYQMLSCYFMTNKFESWKVFIEGMSDWDVFSEKDQLSSLEFMFRTAKIEYLRVLLDCNIHVQVKEKFGIDLRACIFGNPNVNAIEVLKKQSFDVNARATEEQTALHFAVKKGLTKNILFLLHSGADINAKNSHGLTALFDCISRNSTNILLLLLEYNADVQIIDKQGLTAFGYSPYWITELKDFLLAQLAINYVQGIRIKEKHRNLIDNNDRFRKTYDTCCQQLQSLNTYEIASSITLFTVLTDKIEKMYWSLYDQETISLLDQYKQENELHSLYYSIIKNKLNNISNLHRFSCDIADIMSESTGKFVDSDHLVVRKISQYLTPSDIQDFLISMSL